MDKKTMQRIVAGSLIVLGLVVIVGVISLAVGRSGVEVAVESGEGADAATATKAPAPAAVMVPQKVVYTGKLPDSENGADYTEKDIEGEEVTYSYWKRIAITEVNVPVDGASKKEQQKMPSVSVYVEDYNDTIDGINDEYSPLDWDEFALNKGAVWIKYMAKNTDNGKNYGPIARNYKIVVVY